MLLWKDLPPDPRLLEALDQVGDYPAIGNQTEKKNWSNAFADSCALMLANALRTHSDFDGMDIFPSEDGTNTEFKIQPRGGPKKSVDVAATTRAAGLQMALTLKGFNFPRYSHNFTGRIYELNEEVPLIHEHYPQVPVVGVFFLPLSATEEGVHRSSFAFLVEKVRPRTGRDDPLNVGQLKKLDWAVIALYAPESLPQGISRGTCQYFPVENAPPKVGRPRIETTITLPELCDRVGALMTGEGSSIEYADPE